MRRDKPAWDLWHNWKIEECIREPTNTIDDDVLNPSNLSPESHRTGLEELSSPSPGLARLPCELLNIILGYLDLESQASLRLSCRQFFHNCGSSSVFSLRYKMRIDSDPSVRLAWRLIPEWFRGYSQIPSNWLYCGKCATRHSRSSFPEAAIKILPTRRICLGHIKRLYLASDYSVSFTDIDYARRQLRPSIPIKYHNPPRDRAESPASVRCSIDDALQIGPRVPHLLAATRQSAPFIHLWLHYSRELGENWPAHFRPDDWPWYYYLRYFWRFYVDPRNLDTGGSRLRLARDQSVVRFCPHLHSKSGVVASAISSRRSHYAADKSIQGPSVRCEECATDIKIVLDADSPRTSLTVQVTKCLGTLRSAGDADWLAHLE
ncbi:hypothetical protein G7Y79_00075g099070 [Physcia stellaris]|nr:hypothetical protein G7Y79_00075g099070 [Physcia stellaris]